MAHKFYIRYFQYHKVFRFVSPQPSPPYCDRMNITCINSEWPQIIFLKIHCSVFSKIIKLNKLIFYISFAHHYIYTMHFHQSYIRAFFMRNFLRLIARDSNLEENDRKFSTHNEPSSSSIKWWKQNLKQVIQLASYANQTQFPIIFIVLIKEEKQSE